MTDSIIPGTPTAAQLRYLPDHARESMLRYILYGQRPGSFMEAILCNDLMEAARKADDINKYHLYDYFFFLYYFVPSGCQGCRENFERWLACGGLTGIAAADAAGRRYGTDGPAAAPLVPPAPGFAPLTDTGD